VCRHGTIVAWRTRHGSTSSRTRGVRTSTRPYVAGYDQKLDAEATEELRSLEAAGVLTQDAMVIGLGAAAVRACGRRR